jgi:hypothetical protein
MLSSPNLHHRQMVTGLIGTLHPGAVGSAKTRVLAAATPLHGDFERGIFL